MMRNTVNVASAFAFLAAGSLLAHASVGAAQAGPVYPPPAAYQETLPAAVDATRLGAHFSLGLGGELEAEADTGSSDSFDLESTFGVSAFVDFPLHRLFVLGLTARYSSFTTEGWAESNIDRSALLDLAVVPKLRLPLTGSSNLIELYAGVPLGLTLAVMNDEVRNGVKVEGGGGYTAGILGGGNIFFSESVGISLELSYIHHAFANEITDLQTSRKVDMDVTMGQFRLSAGIVAAL